MKRNGENIAGLLLFFSVWSIWAQVQTVGQWGSIDWEKRVVIATGIGAPSPDMPIAAARPNALRAAQLTGLRNALEIVKGIPVHGTSGVQDGMVIDDAVTTRIEGFLQGFMQSGKPKYMSDGSVEVVMEIPIDGSLADELLPENVVDTPQTVKALQGKKKDASFTGLIIDCSGLGLAPSMLPTVYDDQGKIIYGARSISRIWAKKWGSAAYVKSDDSAKTQIDRIGAKALSIRAQKVAGDRNGDVVLSAKDAAQILKSKGNAVPLSECRIIFITE